MQCLNEYHGKNFVAYHGDCCDVLQQFPDNCIDHSVFSPPFGSLFTYSDSICDIGNSASQHEFLQHYRYFAKELTRVLRPGRIAAVHCSDLPTRKWKDGFIGLNTLSDDLIKVHQAAGMIIVRRVTIWKDPVTEMSRTKALNLLYKQLQKDSSMSSPGLPDYLLIFRKPGVNDELIEHKPADFPLDQWQEWASPVWMTINQSNVLNMASQRKAREEQDEKHVCPLQLDLIRRSLIMWSNPDDVVLSPFMGIGSEGHVSLKEGRKFVGIELKKTYFEQAVREMQAIENQGGLFTKIA